MQIPQEELKAVSEALIINPESSHWEELDPLDDDLGDSFLSEFEEDFRVHLHEVH